MATNDAFRGGITVDLNRGTSSLDQGSQGETFFIANDDPAQVETLSDLALSHISRSSFPVVARWRDRLFTELPEICDELPRLLTEFMRKSEKQPQSSYLRRCGAIRHIFANKTAIVHDTDLLPGQTTTSFVGPVVYVDTIGYCIWPELETVSTRTQNPFNIKPEVARRLNREIFPYWLDKNLPVAEMARAEAYDTADFAEEGRDRVESQPSIDPALKKAAGDTPKCQQLLERVAFYLSDKATCVSHTVPDFERVLRFGFDGLIERARQDIASCGADDPESVEFLQGVIEVFEGAKIYAEHLAEAAERVGNTEVAEICRKVPAKPAETLHEAITSIWICYHLLLQENTNFGFSIGRFDQLLNDYYLGDWKKLQSDAERDAYVARAVELVSHFFLHCSDHVPLSTEGSETLFAGSGSNQALTVGGVRRENGQMVNAVNDMTYITLKATEILAIRDPNVHARYHKDVHHRDPQGNPLAADELDPYLRRVCQVNIITRATPAIHGDDPVIGSMASYYADHRGIDEEEALTDAADYASIGCIEQNSAGKHYGNSGSTLFVLPAVLELAIFGGKHRSDGIDEGSLNLFTDKAQCTTKPFAEMTSMSDFVDAFRVQLDAMAQQAVRCNNYLGRTTETMRSSPFLSGIFTGPMNTPETNGARFRDVAAGGAKYSSAGVAVIGLADVIDSFCIMDSLVFSGKVKPKELLAALEADYDAANLNGDSENRGLLDRLTRLFSRFFANGSGGEGELSSLTPARLEEVREMIRLAPKYGAGVDTTPGGPCDNSIAIHYTHLLTEMLQDTFYKYRTHRGGRYLTGYWSMTNHAGFGMLTDATPNGRKKSEPFASGITPCAGIVKTNGDPILALDHILSVASVDANTVKNGYTYNLSLTTRGAAHFEEDNDLFANYMKSFLNEGGVLVQLCISSIKDLTAAHKAATAAETTPGQEEVEAELAPYKDLMIRVAGYSAYFVTLSPQMRQEIIARANFGLADGVEQHATHAT